MPVVSKTTLKGYFEDGKEPDENKYKDLIDSTLLEESGSYTALAISAGLGLPGLRGFWPMSVWALVNPHVRDLSTIGLHLSNSGVQATQRNSQIPCANFGIGSGDKLYRADQAEFDIIGNEGEVASNYRGLTMGCWIRPTNLDSTTQYIIGKWTTSGSQRSYNLRVSTSNKLKALISSTGSDEIAVTSVASLTENVWQFVALHWSPSTQDDFLRAYIDLVIAEQLTSIPSALNNSTARFDIGNHAGVGNYFDGQVALAFLCGQRLSGPALRRFYYQTKSMFELLDP